MLFNVCKIKERKGSKFCHIVVDSGKKIVNCLSFLKCLIKKKYNVIVEVYSFLVST